MSEWISVKDRLPKDDDFVLTCVNGRYHNIKFVNAVMIAQFFPDYGWELETYPDFANPDISHWMPLPEPPEVDT